MLKEPEFIEHLKEDDDVSERIKRELDANRVLVDHKVVEITTRTGRCRSRNRWIRYIHRTVVHPS